MLETAENFQKAFERLEEQNTQYVLEFVGDDRKKGPPLVEDWDNARVFVKFLKIFFDVTLRISGSLFTTSNAYFHKLCLIRNLIRKYLKSNDLLLSDMAQNMKAKYDKYWGNLKRSNLLLYVVVVLDPRYKLKFVQFCFDQLYDKEVAKDMSTRVVDVLRKLYDEYRLLYFHNEVCDLEEFSQPKESELGEQDDLNFVYTFTRHLYEEHNVESKSELDWYLSKSNERVDDGFDILHWWKGNCSKFKVLAQIAKDVLAIPISIVAFESKFSTGG